MVFRIFKWNWRRFKGFLEDIPWELADLFQNSLEMVPGVLEEVQTALEDFSGVFKMVFPWSFLDFQRSLKRFRAP